MKPLVVVSGLSGSGKSTALNMLEDLGYSVVHNLPVELGSAWLEWARREKPDSALAIGLHLQAGDGARPTWLSDEATKTIYLEAGDQVLVRRFSETRRRHPWSTSWDTLVETLAEERACLAGFREQCDHHVDTTSMRASELRQWILETFAIDDHHVQLNIVTFGFKSGVPPYVDLCADVRFLPNPYWDLELRPLTGHDEAVSREVLSHPEAQRWLEEQSASIHWQYGAFAKAGKSYLTMGIGCTGGRHRSVAMAVALADSLTKRGLRVNMRHRETPIPVR
jgi:UPF0042 nucleotide-binding protein